ncbi:MAG: peptidylprolyl isomerase [Proteobacteria bacterium]|jgi:cyclophilin family peptidyl-prolyl cis-trans isomerase|nr:peptidylprolyl isomerase [Pseudomonadota bacterium]MDA0872735.1 peptidylprolyl isomerase [Pseudomonadota bacterium]MDA1133390.1 peptidylprolyl isomerase [Pseudomonadota bacterium]
MNKNLKKYLLIFLLFFTHVTFGQSVVIETTQGDIVVELNPEKAPNTVKNFLTYVNEGFYAGTIFHRVIRDFMIQGGGFDKNLNQKETREPIQNESKNGLFNETYTIAMARTNDPHSATSQFFINLKDNYFLDDGDGYCVFGKVTSGHRVVQKIGSLPTHVKEGMGDVPIKRVTIKAIKIIN